MTTTPVRPAVTVGDIQHPSWCHLSQCVPGPRLTEVEHFSRGTMRPSRADAAETTVKLIHADDPHGITGRDKAQTLVMLDIHHTELFDETGVRYSPAEARLVAAALTRYAEDADREDRIRGHRCTAEEIREGRR